MRKLRRFRKVTIWLALSMGLVVTTLPLTVDGHSAKCYNISSKSLSANYHWSLCKVPQTPDNAPDPDE